MEKIKRTLITGSASETSVGSLPRVETVQMYEVFI